MSNIKAALLERARVYHLRSKAAHRRGDRGRAKKLNDVSFSYFQAAERLK